MKNFPGGKEYLEKLQLLILFRKSFIPLLLAYSLFKGKCYIQKVFFFPWFSEFEKAEQKRMEEQMGQYARDLERETNQEKEKYEKNFEALSKRKDDIIKSKRDKMKVQCGYFSRR